MEGKTIVLGILIVGIIAAGTFIVVAGAGRQPFAGERFAAGRGHGMMMDPDRIFIEQMIPHHQDAVDMGELALVRAEHPEIRQLAQDIIRDQSREISLMRDWYREWYGTDVPEYPVLTEGGRGMMHGMAGDGTDLVDLAGATLFDKEFIEQMIPHHQMAIMMAWMVVRNSDRPELQDLGRSIIRTQSAEVDQMRAWYRMWYGTEFSGSPMAGMTMGFRQGIGR